MKIMEKFKEWYENRHQYAKEWKQKTGNKVFGYFCTYIPEEILYAADILPVRILGSHEPQDITEPYIFGMYCPFCRDCLAQGLKGRYDYLDGIGIAQSCLHIRQAFTSWQLHIPIDYSYYLPMPAHIQSPRALPYLKSELMTFKKSLEDWTKKEIDDEQIEKGISILNENRRLLKELYELRKDSNPPISGLEAMYAVVSSQLIDKREHNRELKEEISKIRNGEYEIRNTESLVRLMMIGSENDDVEFIKMVESLGAQVVIDDHCTGTRYFWNQTQHFAKSAGDKMLAIAQRYIERPACPSKDWPERTRIPHILKLAKDYSVAGAILVQQKFCDPHELDIPAIKKTLTENGIPTLFLELDVTVPIGQFRTRVEAFLETLREEDLF